MPITWRSGLDWSGDGGDPTKRGSSRRLVVVLASVANAQLSGLEQALGEIRIRADLPSSYAFKFTDSRPAIRRAFFSRIAQESLLFQAAVIDKIEWGPTYIQQTTGQQLVIEAIVRSVLGTPDYLVAQQVLLIDLPKQETTVVRAIRGALKDGCKAAERRPYAKIKPCPDNRLEGDLIQLADMVAGGLQERGSLSNPLLTPLRDKIMLV